MFSNYFANQGMLHLLYKARNGGENMDKLKQVIALKQELDQCRPLPPEAVKNLREIYRVEWTYNSNAIEGNTLTILETKLVIEEGITIGGKQLREHFEVINHKEAIEFVEEFVSKEELLTEIMLKQIHYLILKNIDNKNAGVYRKVNVGISGSEHQPPHFLALEDEMRKLFCWYEVNKSLLHPVELAAIFHFKFVYIHPFADGNGRTARLLLNLILMKHGYPPAIVKAAPNSRIKYYETLELASVKNEVQPFIEVVATCVEESLKRYLHVIK